MSREQMADLAKRFPSNIVRKDPRGNVYVEHGVITQKLLKSLDNGFSFEVSQIIRSDMPAIAPDPSGSSQRAKRGSPAIPQACVAVICRLSTRIDDQPYTVEEVGECGDPYNWSQDGARLKDAMSDALKRCAMRIGVGLHLWCEKNNSYFLDKLLDDEPSESSE